MAFETGLGMVFVPQVNGEVSAVELNGERFDLEAPYPVKAGVEYVAIVVDGIAEVMLKDDVPLLANDNNEPQTLH